MTTNAFFPVVKDQTKVTHATTARGAKIIRRTKDNTWYLKRGDAKIALTIQEAACIASDGYVIHGLEGGEAFERMVQEIWSRAVTKTKKLPVRKVTGDDVTP
jgi:hypothetical protein